MSENPLHLLMNPRSIAVVGANNVPTKMGTIQALSIIKGGFKGKFFPVHPKEKTVLGVKAYASVEELPEAPDLAMLIVPVKTVIPLIESFGKIGTKRAIIVTAGFKETGASGQRMENELNAVAEHYGMRFVGPNCLGIINSKISLNTTVFSIDKEPGLLGFASQSGTYVTQALPALRKRGIRFSQSLSLGNEANINMIDALEYLGEDEQTKAIILYIEGIRDGKRFVEVARKITPYKPVLAQYVGGSASGARAGMSHTGAMAGPDFLYDGIFKQAGIIRVNAVEDLYANGWALATQPPLRGNRVGIMTNSGGPSTTISYLCDSAGLEVPRFSEGLQKEIRQHIEPHASAANPVDLTFDVGIQKLAITLPEMMIKSGEVDAIVVHGAMMTGYLREIYPHLREMAGNITLEEFLKFGEPVINEAFELPHKCNMPFLISSFFDGDDCYTQGYQDHNIPVFRFPEKTAIALGCLYNYKKIKERAPYKEVVLPEIHPLAADIIQKAKQNRQKALNEYEAKKLLSCYGLPVTKEALAANLQETLDAAAKIGYPVALKACSWEIMHKSGKGLIALGVNDETRLKKEFENIQKNAGKNVPVLVQEMLYGNREFLAGMARFAGFGPCVVFGLGGVFTEIYKDTTLRLAPFAEKDAREMFTEIRAKKLLDEFRGMPEVNKEKLSQVLQTIGNISLLHPEIAEIDLNPIMINGDEPVIADALIVLEDKKKS